MNSSEALQIAEQELGVYRAMTYSEIAAKVGSCEHFDRLSAANEPYQVQVDFWFDDGNKENIRVCSMVSYSFWTDFSPVSSDFIMAPDGRFIGE